jgi:hypothetical protein
MLTAAAARLIHNSNHDYDNSGTLQESDPAIGEGLLYTEF